MTSLSDRTRLKSRPRWTIAQSGAVVLMKSIARQLNRIAVSDRTTFRGLTQFVFDDLACVHNLGHNFANRAPMSCRRQRLASLIRVPAAWHLSPTQVPRIHLSLDGDGGVALPGPQTAASSPCGRATALRDEGERSSEATGYGRTVGMDSRQSARRLRSPRARRPENARVSTVSPRLALNNAAR